MKFATTASYVASDDLALAVNAAVTLQRPLLVKGEPGTGKTELARQVAGALDLPLIEWHVKSTTKAQQGLYEYDAVSRLRDSQLGEARVHDVRNYIRKGKLWQAFEAEGRVVLLIDEIDKADIEFPNDLLQEIDRMEFHVYETGEMVRKGTAGCVSAAVFFSLHPVSRCGHAGGHRAGAFSGYQGSAADRRFDAVLRIARGAGLEEKAVNQRGSGLVAVALGRGSGAGGSAEGSEELPAPAAWRVVEERAGCAAVRAAGLHGAVAALAARRGANHVQGAQGRRVPARGKCRICNIP
jgi:AAA domain (dynein-related subfamily)